MPPSRLILLFSAAGDAATAGVRRSLASWCRAGLLGRVVWAGADDINSLDESDENGENGDCWLVKGREWVPGRLDEALSGELSEVWCVALRGALTASKSQLSIEERALETIHGRFGSGVTVRSATVTTAAEGREFMLSDFSAMWDMHLIHDTRVTPDTRSAMANASDSDVLSLCAAAALCAAGGWSAPTDPISLDDRADGPVRHPRIVHAQQRVMHIPRLIVRGIQNSPPWPTPSKAGVRRAPTGLMPPLSLARHLVNMCRFKCAKAPTRAESAPKPGFWRLLLDDLPVPAPRTETEQALQRLANRTGGYAAQDTDSGVVPLGLGTEGEPIDMDGLVQQIKQSDFPTGTGSAGAKPTPETWRTLREVFFGLVDGGDMPSGAQFVRNMHGRPGETIVWTDPSVLTPQQESEEPPPPDMPPPDDHHTQTPQQESEEPPLPDMPPPAADLSPPPLPNMPPPAADLSPPPLPNMPPPAADLSPPPLPNMPPPAADLSPPPLPDMPPPAPHHHMPATPVEAGVATDPVRHPPVPHHHMPATPVEAGVATDPVRHPPAPHHHMPATQQELEESLRVGVRPPAPYRHVPAPQQETESGSAAAGNDRHTENAAASADRGVASQNRRDPGGSAAEHTAAAQPVSWRVSERPLDDNAAGPAVAAQSDAPDDRSDWWQKALWTALENAENKQKAAKRRVDKRRAERAARRRARRQF